MKKNILLIALLLSLSLPIVLAFSGCNGCSEQIDWNELNIADYSSYTALGAAVVDGDLVSTKSVKSGNFIVANAADKEYKLVGQKTDGTLEVISFVNNDGETVEQSLQLGAIRAYDNFTFLYYTPTAVTKLEYLDTKGSISNLESLAFYHGFSDDGKLSNSATGYYFIIDNKSGKIFDARNVIAEIVGDEAEYYGGDLDDYMEYGDSAYIIYRSCGVDGYNNDYSGYFKMEMFDSKLKVTKVLPASKLGDFCGVDDYLNFGELVVVDNYGNVFSNIQGCVDYSADKTAYILRKDGTVNSLDSYKKNGKLFKAVNGLVYYKTDSETKVFDENGNLVDSDFVPPTEYYVNMKDYINDPVYKTENVHYYYGFNSSLYEGDNIDYDNIHKFTFNGIEFEYEKITLEDKSESYIIANDRIYFLRDDEIFYCSLNTGKKTLLVSDYKFKTLEKDYKGNLIFTGVTDTLDDVKGVITADDEISVIIDEYIGSIEVVYIKPIN